ncbi:MAG: tRNA (adenosine(37)-N6)-threonylcarbamoyltransferase complex dimerization subunit type 1 TsaB [Treponema sp.]|nr:tRNA (adenosine(37)-N6)-threonylcarbamoyltransferase complex dimerization subunit type 1 TsaB [Treponema sp.]
MKTQKKICAIDSCARILSVSVSNGENIFSEESHEELKHSEHIMGLIDNQIKKASLKPCDLEGILCMAGPGSFTGLRIGYSTAKGLALALSIPFASVPTLDCIAFQRTANNTPKLVLAVIEARKNAYFYAFYNFPAPDLPQRLTAIADGCPQQINEAVNQYSENLVLTGPGCDLLYESLPPETREKIVLQYEKKGYSNEIIRLAQITSILDNDNMGCLYSGPEYYRESDAQARFGVV